jgi:Skp family chaperone for outer membrane proteins
MKLPRLSVLALFVTLFAAASAQQPAAAPAAKPATPAAKKEIPLARIAWVNTAAFGAEETGIKQMIRAIHELELEFSGAQSELSLLQEKLRTIVGELQKLQAGDAAANAEALKSKQAEGLKLQQEFQTKQQHAQQAFAEAQQQKQGPVATEIGKALTAYAKERDIAIILDAAKLGDAILTSKPELDVTEDFIAYYNATHP